MTIAPTLPNLIDGPGTNNKTLIEPHVTFVHLWFGYSLMVYIGKGYVTDGATVPQNIGECPKCYEYIKTQYPKISTRYDMESLIDILVGSPWDMPRLLGAIVHDALYDYQWMCRWVCDRIYKLVLLQFDYPVMRANVEHFCIRLCGNRNWEGVTDLDRDRTRQLVEVKIIKTKEIDSKIVELKKR